MQEETYRATTIVVPDVKSHAQLNEAFNSWAEKELPEQILHVHYYHDLRSHARGFQVVYKERWRAAEQGEAPPALAGLRSQA